MTKLVVCATGADHRRADAALRQALGEIGGLRLAAREYKRRDDKAEEWPSVERERAHDQQIGMKEDNPVAVASM